MKTLSIDLETFCEIDLTKTGVYRYANDPSFEILLFAYSTDGGPVEILDLASGDVVPSYIKEALFDPNVIKTAYNAAFEMYCLSVYFGEHLPAEQWRDTQLHSLYLGYPTTLEKAAVAIGLPEDKLKDSKGKSLINFFSKPRKPTKNDDRTRNMPADDPDRWQLFKDYCRQDVRVEMEIEQWLSKWPVPAFVQAQWITDMRIVERGVKVDMELVEGALECRERIVEERQAEFREITGLESATEVAKLKAWAESRLGQTLTSLDKDAIKALLKTDLPADVRRALEIRLEVSKTSIAKFGAIKQRVDADGRCRGMLMFYGANRTGRWAGRGVQMQNLAKTFIQNQALARDLVKARDVEMLKLLFGNVSDVLSQLVRTAFVPDDGKVFIDADFSAIEARAIAWEADEQWALEEFKGAGKIYEATASMMYRVPVEEVGKGSQLRQYGKTAVLGCGFGAGAGGLRKMDKEERLTDAELEDIKTKWRDANPRIVRLWYALNNAAVDTVQTGRTNKVRMFIFRYESDPATNQFFLTIELPSGRKLFYVRPEIKTGKFGNPAVCYWGLHQERKTWIQVDTFGGKFAENLTQALARDILAENIERLEAAGFPIVFHVHDEVIVETTDRQADALLGEVCRIMGQPIAWADGLPLGAEGWTGYFYTKD